MPSRKVLYTAITALVAAIVMGAAALLVQRGPEIVRGTALVGGPFSLVDQNGRRITEKNFAGGHMLVFFGYTFCPDVCPGGLQVMSEALDILGPDAGGIQPVFITIDPARDTQAVLKEYVANFHPRLIGLTGSAEEIAAAAKAYRVYYAIPKSEEGKSEYLMDHSSFFYLMDPEGRFVTHIAYGTSAADFAAKIKAALAGN